MKLRTVAVVGGGLVGLSVARALATRGVAQHVVLIEKEDQVGRHQSGHNSGVLHCGLHYRPGSLKAKLAVEGIRLMTDYAQRHGINHDVCGKIVVATTRGEVPRLEELQRRGQANGLVGLRRLTPGEVAELEPHAACVAGLHVPEEGIIDYPKVSQTLLSELIALGVEVHLGQELRAVRSDSAGWRLSAGEVEIQADFVVGCAGLYSDRLAGMFGLDSPVRIVPFRGDYFHLRTDRTHLVRNLLYPVPDPTFPFLGVHLHRTIHGTVECGPTAALSLAREGYGRASFNLSDAIDSLGFRGLRNFLWRYPGVAVRGVGQSVSRRWFANSLARLVPGIRPEDLSGGWSGVRAQAMTADGELVKDFVFARGASSLHVINAPSPAATASLAIGEYVAAEVAKG